MQVQLCPWEQAAQCSISPPRPNSVPKLDCPCNPPPSRCLFDTALSLPWKSFRSVRDRSRGSSTQVARGEGESLEGGRLARFWRVITSVVKDEALAGVPSGGARLPKFRPNSWNLVARARFAPLSLRDPVVVKKQFQRHRRQSGKHRR